MAKMGYHVTVYPILRNEHNLAAVYADFPDTVEVMHNRCLADLDVFLASRRDYYNTIWIARTHNLDLVKPVLESREVDVLGSARVVLDTEAIDAPREAQHRIILGMTQPFDVEQAIAHELRHAYFCRGIVTVSAREAEWLRNFGLHDVSILGHMRSLTPTPRSWNERAGMLFVGSVLTHDTPNHDSLCWFVDEVLPLIEQTLGWQTRLTIVGFVGVGKLLDRFHHHPRITLRQTIADVTPLYNAHRVFIAPTRYGAGLPYKIHEAASFGVPVVATECLRHQLGWEDGREILSADATNPGAFAQQVLAIHQSEALWNRIRAGAAERIRIECNDAAYEKVLANILRYPR